MADFLIVKLLKETKIILFNYWNHLKNFKFIYNNFEIKKF